MYICLCNSIRDKDIEQCISQGCNSTSDLFKAMNCRPQCGQCVEYMRSQLGGESSSGGMQ